MAVRFDDWEGEYLQHYGVLGMKWGQRRYQNADGSLTAAGKKHYEQTGEYGYQYHSHATKKYTKKAEKQIKKIGAINQKLLSDSANGKTYSEKEATKIADKKSKLLSKAAKYDNRAKRSAEIDRGEQEYANGLSNGKAIALTLLTSGTVTKGYAQYRAMSGQSGKNMTGRKVVSAILASQFGSAGSRQRKAAYIRQDEGKNGLGQKAFKLNTKIQNTAGNIIDNAANSSGGFPDREKNKKKKSS